jgi:hypothetical protein
MTPVRGRRSGQWQLTRVGRIQRFGPRFMMRFSPTTSGRYEGLDQLTFGHWLPVWTAGIDGIILVNKANG